MVPGVSFYGALADLLADLVTTDMPHVDMITVAYAVSGWRMTTASKTTAAQLNGTDRVLYINGTYQVAPAGTGRASFAFPPPIGTRTVLVDYPAGEVVTIPRHVPAQSVRALMTADTFTEDAVFTSENLDPAARAIGFHHRRARGLGNQYPRWLPARPRHLPSRRHHLRRGGQPPRPRPRPARRGCSQRHRSIPTRSLLELGLRPDVARLPNGRAMSHPCGGTSYPERAQEVPPAPVFGPSAHYERDHRKASPDGGLGRH